ncbi:hypothetical protein [Sphingomonas sp.]|uniref:hypothetical protein n=1 Tax=Sphingomonas sp. TaxID=28214 RepID=UPI002DD66798|nr:hypothetical protein [Sphingomonas sp.]
MIAVLAVALIVGAGLVLAMVLASRGPATRRGDAGAGGEGGDGGGWSSDSASSCGDGGGGCD